MRPGAADGRRQRAELQGAHQRPLPAGGARGRIGRGRIAGGRVCRGAVHCRRSPSRRGRLVASLPGKLRLTSDSENFLGEFITKGLATSMALIWRLVSYYPYLIIGVIILPRWIRKHFRREEVVVPQ